MANSGGYPLAYANRDLSYQGLWAAELLRRWTVQETLGEMVVNIERQIVVAQTRICELESGVLLTAEAYEELRTLQCFLDQKSPDFFYALKDLHRSASELSSLEAYVRSYGVDIEGQMWKLAGW